MRRLLPLIILALSINCLAQKNTLKVHYSPLPFLKVDKEWLHTNTYENSKYSGAFTLDYYRNIHNALNIGFTIGYESSSSEGEISGYYQPTYPNHNNGHAIEYESAEKKRYLYFGPQICYYYLRKDNFKLGSGISIVLLTNNTTQTLEFHETESKSLDVFTHIELLSFNWGKTNGLTGQLGFGHKGIFSLGYFVHF